MMVCISSARWPIVGLCYIALMFAATVNMLLVRKQFVSILLAYSGASSIVPYPLQHQMTEEGGPDLFEAFQGTLETMQGRPFWNGTYWPATIQWIGAVMNTFIISAEQSLVNALQDMDGTALLPAASDSTLQEDIQQYWNGIVAYYDAEDTSQIFGAAYDDAQWVVLEWVQAIRFMTRNEVYANSSQSEVIGKFAHRAHIFYNIVQNQFNTSECGGGITWNPALAPYKNAITNELFLSSSIAMYLYFPGDNDTDPYPDPKYKKHKNRDLPLLKPLAAHDSLFLDNAKKQWTWFVSHNFTNAQGLIVDGFHISKNQTTCDQRNEMVYTYNQGVLLSGLRGLWEATGDTAYLFAAYDFINNTIAATGWFSSSTSNVATWAGLGRNGIMEDYCDAAAKCSQDAQIFKGIYFQHLEQFCERLPTSTPLIPDVTYTAPALLASHHSHKCQSYIPWIRRNAIAALRTRNSSNVIGGWWGASHLNETQRPSSQWVQPLPPGSLDIMNEPTMLGRAPWRLQRQQYRYAPSEGKYQSPYDGAEDNVGRLETVLEDARHIKDPNDRGRGRTIESQASGMAVVKAAFDFSSGLKVSRDGS